MDGDRGRGGRHQFWGKINLMSIGTKRDRTHPSLEKNEPSIPNVSHNMASMRIMPVPMVDCHGWQQRLWPTSPMVGMFVCVCAKSRSYKNCGISLSVVQKSNKPQNP